jgi:hypothetical protein
MLNAHVLGETRDRIAGLDALLDPRPQHVIQRHGHLNFVTNRYVIVA